MLRFTPNMLSLSPVLPVSLSPVIPLSLLHYIIHIKIYKKHSLSTNLIFMNLDAINR